MAVKATSAAAGRLIIALWRPARVPPGAAATEALQQGGHHGGGCYVGDAARDAHPDAADSTIRVARCRLAFAQNPIDGTVYIADSRRLAARP